MFCGYSQTCSRCGKKYIGGIVWMPALCPDCEMEQTTATDETEKKEGEE
jgi:hypothetical protein